MVQSNLPKNWQSHLISEILSDVAVGLNTPVALFGLLYFVFDELISAAGLCDINEGSATSEDRCKSPTSGNMSFSVLLKRKEGELQQRLCVI